MGDNTIILLIVKFALSSRLNFLPNYLMSSHIATMDSDNVKIAINFDDPAAPNWLSGYTQKVINAMGPYIANTVSSAVEKATVNERKIIQILENKCNKQQGIINHLSQRHERQTERIIAMETRSMRNNLLFQGLNEEENENPATLKANIMAILTGDLEITDVIVILRCHRIPLSLHQKGPRNVVVRFADSDHVQVILRSAKKLKGREPELYINRQYPREIVDRRRILPCVQGGQISGISSNSNR